MKKKRIDVDEELGGLCDSKLKEFREKLYNLQSVCHNLDLSYRIKGFKNIRDKINSNLKEIYSILSDEISPNFNKLQEVDCWDIDYEPTPVEKITGGIDELLTKNISVRVTPTTTPTVDKILEKVFSKVCTEAN